MPTTRGRRTARRARYRGQHILLHTLSALADKEARFRNLLACLLALLLFAATTTTAPPASADPVIARRGTPTWTATTTGSTSASIDTPAGIQDADLLLLTINSVWTQTSYTLAGWTQELQVNSTNSSTAIFSKVWHTGDPTTYTPSWGKSGKVAMIMAAYSGVDPTAPVLAKAIVAETVSRTAHTTPTVVNTNAGAWAVALYADRSTSSSARNSDWTADPGLSERADVNNYAASLSPWVSAQFADSNGPVSTGGHAYTATATVAQSDATMALLYLNPTAPAPTTTTTAPTTSAATTTTPTTSATTTTAPPPSADPVIAAAGDIACDPSDANYNGGHGTASYCHQEATANLLTQSPFTAILTLGDNQYADGTLAKFQQSFDPSWGRSKPLIYPVPGNHEYLDTNAQGYYGYFGAAAGVPSKGWYSFDLGRWHVIALNGECSQIGGCGAGSPQEQWLKADLAAHPAACTLAFWHEPRFSSGVNQGVNPAYAAFWQDLYTAGADLVLNGHIHNYERFAPQAPDGTAEPASGVRQFIVGTGGKNLVGFTNPVLANSEARNADAYGVLKLTLHPTSYDWTFLPEAGKTFTDSGTTACH
jgi:acid phosphatase type 7